MRRSKEDILRSLTGESTDMQNITTQEPTSLLSKVKNGITDTTDKVGITTAGTLTRTFFWGVAIGVVGVLALGYYKDKISISYTK